MVLIDKEIDFWQWVVLQISNSYHQLKSGARQILEPEIIV